MELITGENDKNRRLDRILRKALPDYPLPLIHKLLRQKKVTVNGKRAKADDRLESGDKILITEPNKNISSSNPSSRKPNVQCACIRTSSLDILWESSELVAVNKPAGISVHGPDSLDTQVNSFLADKLPPSLSFKPGPLHRLDKPTSGIVVFSKSLEGARLFSSLMREHKIKKTYLAVVEGKIENNEIWQDELVRDKERKKTYIDNDAFCVKSPQKSGKTAVTCVIPLAVIDNYTLIKAQITTGRTHQIRAQAAHHGHPLAGDVKYRGKLRWRNGGKKLAESEQKADIFLHAWKMEFLQYSVKAPLPVSWDKWPFQALLGN